MTELAQSLKNRVYYAARDGMAMTLVTLLAEKTDKDIHELLNQVGFLFWVSYNDLRKWKSWLTNQVQ